MDVLIIDDDRLAASDLASRLGSYDGIRVCGTAHNGADGLKMLGDTQPDLLFLDIELPDISGIDFLELVEGRTGRRCRVVMYTAHSRFMLPAFRGRAFDYLLKPVDDAELRTIMRRVMIDMHNQPASSGHMHERDARHSDGSGNATAGEDDKGGISCRADGKCIVYTNAVDFRLVDMHDIGIFAYNHDVRQWELAVSGLDEPIRLRRSVNSDMILALSDSLVRVSQRHIINIAYLTEVADNTCHFYPPFDGIGDVKVGRFFRKKLVERFSGI